MNLVRKLKMSKVTPIEFTDSESKLIAHISDKLKGLVCLDVEGYVGFKFYLNYRKEFVLYYSLITQCYNYTKYLNSIPFINIHVTNEEMSDLIKYILCSNKAIKDYRNEAFYLDNTSIGQNYDNLENLLLKAYNAYEIS